MTFMLIFIRNSRKCNIKFVLNKFNTSHNGTSHMMEHTNNGHKKPIDLPNHEA